MVDLFEDILISLVNNAYVYGGIIFGIMIAIYLVYAFNDAQYFEKNLLDKDKLQESWFLSHKNNQIYILIIFLLLLLFFYFLYHRDKFYDDRLNIFSDDETKKENHMGIPLFNFFFKVGVVLGIIGIIILLLVLFLWGLKHFSSLQFVFNIFIVISFISNVLGIIYILAKAEIDKLISDNNKNKNILEKIMKFFMEFIFIIPCLFVILVDVVKDEIDSTIPTIWILLIIEIIIILLFFLIPFLFTHLNVHDGNVLLKGPVYLNKKYEVGTYQNVQKDKIYKQKIEEYKWTLFKTETNYGDFDFSKNQFSVKKPAFNIETEFTINNKDQQLYKYNYNYGISFFLYLNPQPINTGVAYIKDTVIFDYASKPTVVFNGIDQELKFICKDITNLERTIYKTNDIKYQKWMNIVINYRNGTVDVFIDGTLRASESRLAPFMEYSKIYVGSKNGLAGGIKEVTYFSEPLSLNKIKFINTVLK
jgi:hypothetical protein